MSMSLSRFDRLPRLSVTDEMEFRKVDDAARWLAGAEIWEGRKQRLKAVRKKKRAKRQ